MQPRRLRGERSGVRPRPQVCDQKQEGMEVAPEGHLCGDPRVPLEIRQAEHLAQVLLLRKPLRRDQVRELRPVRNVSLRA